MKRFLRMRAAPAVAALRRRASDAARAGLAAWARLRSRVAATLQRRLAPLATLRRAFDLRAWRRAIDPRTLVRAARDRLEYAATWIVAAARLDRILAAAGASALVAAASGLGGRPGRILFSAIAVANLGGAWAVYASTAAVDRLGRWARELGDGAETTDAAPSFRPPALSGVRSITDVLAAFRARNDRLLTVQARLVRDGGREVERLTAVSQELSAAGEELAATVHQLSDDVGAKADAVQRAAEAAERIAAAAHEVAAGLAEAVRLNHSMRELAEAQHAAMAENTRSVDDLMRDIRATLDGMRDLADAAERTTAFVDTIRAITKQTNTLALNASIEAARFGETGHGFGIVAQEVRQLAGKAARAATEIQLVVRDANRAANQLRRLLGDCIRAGEFVALGVREAVQGFGTVVDRSRAAAEHMVVVRAGMEQIERQIDINTSALEVVSTEVTQLAAATQEMSATAGEMAVGLGELAHAAEALRGLLRSTASTDEAAARPSPMRADAGRDGRPGNADGLRAHEWVPA
ncbi:MAG TPA: methyl-accepting chemotaxis protein [Longimicrobiales bacterium]